MSAAVLEELEVAAEARPAPPERFPHVDVAAWRVFDGDTSAHLAGELPALRPGLAAVVCTYERPASLARCLESLAAQEPPPEAVVVVDASAGADAEAAVAKAAEERELPPTSYFRVKGSLKGLTRQRNFALRVVEHDLVAFFDDDVVLEPGCVATLERVLRENREASGAGVFVTNESSSPNLLWKTRRLLGIVPHLVPGRYTRTGMSIPWSFLGPRTGVVRGDFVPGCGMAFRTTAARATGFHEGFHGYAQGEDLEFSLRVRRFGPLFLACEARLRHDVEPAARPDAFRLGYMAIRNRWVIHRRDVAYHRRGRAARFAWAWTLDTLLLFRHFLFPSRAKRTLLEIRGRLKAAREIYMERAAS
jgi:GT2 family glycosyltransferase